MDKPEIDPKTGLWKEPQPYDFRIGAGNTATEPEHSPYYYDYTRNDPNRENPLKMMDSITKPIIIIQQILMTCICIISQMLIHHIMMGGHKNIIKNN